MLSMITLCCANKIKDQLTVEADVNLLGHGGCGVCVGGLAHKLGAQVLPHQPRVGHGVGHGVVVADLEGAVVDASLPPPGDAGPGAATSDLANHCQVIPNLLARIKAFFIFLIAKIFIGLALAMIDNK